MDIVYFILIGLIAGWLAGVLVKGGGFGIIGDIIVGIIGALIGGFIFRRIGYNATGLIGEIIVATIGAIVLIIILRLIRKAA